MPDYPEDLKYSAEHEWVRSGNEQHRAGRHHRVRRRPARRHRLRLACPRSATPWPPATPAASSSRPRACPTSSARWPGWSPRSTRCSTGSPETINADPYGDGWLFEVELDEGADLDDLLDADAYAEQLGA